MKANRALQPLYLKSTFAVKIYFVFHIMIEEPSQRIQSDSAFASQNLKFS